MDPDCKMKGLNDCQNVHIAVFHKISLEFKCLVLHVNFGINFKITISVCFQLVAATHTVLLVFSKVKRAAAVFL